MNRNGRPKRVIITQEFQDIYAGRMNDIKYRAYNNQFWVNGPQGEKQLISEMFPTGCMEGKPAFIIGGGPSASMVNLKLLDNYFSIGCNFIWTFYTPTVDMAADYTVIRDRMLTDKKYIDSESIKLFMDLDNKPWDYYYTRAAGFMEHSSNVDELYHGSHTGFMAVQFAMALKANPIYLIGIDFTRFEGEAHATEDWGEAPHQDETNGKFNREFKLFCKYFLNDTQLINLSPISETAKYLPTQDYYEVLNGK